MSMQLISVMRCPACLAARPAKTTYVLEQFSVYDCPECFVRYIDPSMTEAQQIEIYQSSESLKSVNAVLEKYYEFDLLNEKTNTYKDYKMALEKLGRITSGRKLCEIGCGTGAFLKVAKKNGWDVTGLDSSAENIAALKEAGIAAMHSNMFESRDMPQFDVVVLWDVIEHPQVPSQLIELCKKMFAPQGVLLIAAPCFPSLLSLVAGILYKLSFGAIRGPLEKMYVVEHTSYFSIETLKRLLVKCNMTILESWKTETDLERYALSPWLRQGIQLGFFLGRFLNLQNRLAIVARPKI